MVGDGRLTADGCGLRLRTHPIPLTLSTKQETFLRLLSHWEHEKEKNLKHVPSSLQRIIADALRFSRCKL
jgi:hypothetical protein